MCIFRLWLFFFFIGFLFIWYVIVLDEELDLEICLGNGILLIVYY